MKNFTIKKRYNDTENPYWLSFSDAMSGLLIIFILASLSLILQLQNKIDAETKTRKEVKQELKNIQTKLASAGIHVEVDDNIIRIPTDEIHFETNEDKIPKDKINNVKVIGIHIFNYVSANKDKIDTVFIEGHTDFRQTNRKNGNWGLSADRAIAVWKVWQDNICEDCKFETLKNEDEPIFSVSGYGDTRPVEGTKSSINEEDLKKNRRIDVRFVTSKPKYLQQGEL